MIPELGLFALILALCLAVMLSVVPMVGYARRDRQWMLASKSLAAGQFVFVLFSFICLVYVFLTDDFSVAIVAAQSNTALPDIFKFSAVWGGHEGSLLLWILILAAWTVAVAIFSRSLSDDVVAIVLAVMGMIGVGFLSFALFTSNPFDRLILNTPMDGQDLNPLLQDFGLVIHPPMLYVGYVGFSVAFAFAIAALITGRIDASWARWTRPWTNVAWAFLTVGIALGSWWAYYELGWGGWWFWDPVENASFMPWLVGTALVHSLAATEKRGVFKSWTLLLAIFAFSLSLLGTFLVRSGILTSVHSFAADPSRGMYILAFLAIVVGGSLTLYAFRAPTNYRSPEFSGSSREALLLANNVLFVAAAGVVLVGTLFPLVMDFLKLGKYSVGPPFFNAGFVPLMCITAALTGLGPSSHWKRTEASLLKAQLAVALIAAIIIGALFPYFYGGEFHLSATITIILAAWLLLSAIRHLMHQTRNAPSFIAGLKRLTLSYYGMALAHLGFAAAIVGVGLVSTYTIEKDIRMEVGEQMDLAGFDIRFQKIESVVGPNYRGQRGTFIVTKNGNPVADLHPEKRRYNARSGQLMTEAGIDGRLMRDLYVAMGEPVGEDAWAVRLHYKPFVRWMWLGALMMAFGAIIAVCDKRYRLARKQSSASSVGLASTIS